jgi:HipA-like protein
MALRGFSAEVEGLAAEWRNAPVTAEAWTTDGNMFAAPGEAGGCFVVSGNRRGWAKPGAKKMDDCPRAAHEKIASDLAFELGLPVPPVVLWERKNGGLQDETFCCISAIPFDAAIKWGQIAAVPTTAARLLAAFPAHASAMSVFDCWVDNQDRHNDGNVLASEAGGVARVAYIDYSYALSHSWGQQVPDPIPGPGRYPATAADEAAAKDCLAAIEGLTEEKIREIVNRVPDQFLPAAKKVIISDGLIARRPKIRAALRGHYPGV